MRVPIGVLGSVKTEDGESQNFFRYSQMADSPYRSARMT